MALGFGDPRATPENKWFRDDVGSPWAVRVPLAALHDAALDLLAAVDEGRPAGPLARALALDVLRAAAPDSKPWLLAVAVLEGGALRVRHAVELAGVLVQLAEQVDASEGSALG